MGLLEQQNFLAKLYTKETVRQSFIKNPNSFGKNNGLTEGEISEIQSIFEEEIVAFAISLFYKRLREVERILPLTRKALGNDFEKLFKEFIKEFNPKTVKKHQEDAIHFAKFLKSKDFSGIIKNLVLFELNKLRVNTQGKRFIFEIYDFDFRKINFHTLPKVAELKKRKTLSIWINFLNYQRHFIL